MNIKKTAPPLVTGLISTALCFSLGFFNNVFKYNGLEFFYAYIAFSIILCYPMNLVAVYLERAYPQLHTHSGLVKQITGSSKLRVFSILLTGTTIIILSLIVFSISSYFLDFFDNVPAIDRLSNASLNFNASFPIYTILLIVFIAMMLLLLLANKNKINLNNILKTLAHTSLYLVTILMLMAIYMPNSFIGIKDFIFTLNYQTTIQMYNMLGMAMLYAIISNFISLSLYKNILEVIGDESKKLKLTAFKSIFYNLTFSLIVCITIYAILGDYRTLIQPTEDLDITTVFTIVKSNSPIYYLLLEIIFITFQLIVFVAALKYISEITNKLYIKMLVLSIPFIMTISFIANDFIVLNFSTMFELHLLIIYLFLFDVFLIGWIYDAQKISYEIIKNTGTKLSPLFNIILRIVIPFVCIIVTIGYIFPTINIILQILSSVVCLVIYIIKGTIFHNIFNKRKL
jgi:hypothetical protein